MSVLAVEIGERYVFLRKLNYIAQPMLLGNISRFISARDIPENDGSAAEAKSV